MGSLRSRRPDGIDDAAMGSGPGLSRHASVLSLVVLGAVLAVGLSGLVGGRSEHHVANDGGLRLSLTAPVVMRSGNLMETRLQLVASKRIGQLVIGVESGLWRDLTTNTTTPVASTEGYRDGLYRFEFGPVEAEAAFRWQIAQQLNPNLFGVNRGRIVVLDGQRQLGELQLKLIVLP
jgi:hypothetical protein